MAVGLVVALVAGVGGWSGRQPHRRRSGQRAGDRQGARRRPGATEGLQRLGAGRAPARRPRPRRRSRVHALRRAGDDRLGRACCPPTTRRSFPPRWWQAAEGGLPKAEKAKVVGLEARAYRGIRTGDSVLDVYAIPTTRGVLTLVCTARNGGAEAPTWCLNGLDQITVDGAQPITPKAGTAYELRAPVILKGLDEARVRERMALRRSKGPVGQERAARTLWKAYGDAAAELAPYAAAGRAVRARRRLPARDRPRLPSARRRGAPAQQACLGACPDWRQPGGARAQDPRRRDLAPALIREWDLVRPRTVKLARRWG